MVGYRWPPGKVRRARVRPGSASAAQRGGAAEQRPPRPRAAPQRGLRGARRARPAVLASAPPAAKPRARPQSAPARRSTPPAPVPVAVQATRARRRDADKPRRRPRPRPRPRPRSARADSGDGLVVSGVSPGGRPQSARAAAPADSPPPPDDWADADESVSVTLNRSANRINMIVRSTNVAHADTSFSVPWHALDDVDDGDPVSAASSVVTCASDGSLCVCGRCVGAAPARAGPAAAPPPHLSSTRLRALVAGGPSGESRAADDEPSLGIRGLHAAPPEPSQMYREPSLGELLRRATSVERLLPNPEDERQRELAGSVRARLAATERARPRAARGDPGTLTQKKRDEWERVRRQRHGREVPEHLEYEDEWVCYGWPSSPQPRVRGARAY